MPTDCWIDRHAPSCRGYARASAAGRQRLAHIIAWEQAAGAPVPPGRIVCHSCDVRNCVRNDDAGTYEVDGVSYPRYGHLWLGTIAANNRDREAKNRTRLAPVRGERHYAAKLTDADVARIRARAGEPHLSIARDFGVNSSTVRSIILGHTWKQPTSWD